MLDSAIQGTKNVLEEAVRAGIKRLVVTSSHSALYNLNKGENLHPNLYNDKGKLTTQNDERITEL